MPKSRCWDLSVHKRFQFRCLKEIAGQLKGTFGHRLWCGSMRIPLIRKSFVIQIDLLQWSAIPAILLNVCAAQAPKRSKSWRKRMAKDTVGSEFLSFFFGQDIIEFKISFSLDTWYIYLDHYVTSNVQVATVWSVSGTKVLQFQKDWAPNANQVGWQGEETQEKKPSNCRKFFYFFSTDGILITCRRAAIKANTALCPQLPFYNEEVQCAW